MPMSFTDQTTGNSAPPPVRKKPLRIAQNCAAPAINGSAYGAAQRVHMPGINRIAPTNSADMLFCFEHKGTPAEYSAGLKLAIERGWLELHESGTYVKFTQTGADLFA
jgi:hypothetical protein